MDQRNTRLTAPKAPIQTSVFALRTCSAVNLVFVRAMGLTDKLDVHPGNLLWARVDWPEVVMFTRNIVWTRKGLVRDFKQLGR